MINKLVDWFKTKTDKLLGDIDALGDSLHNLPTDGCCSGSTPADDMTHVGTEYQKTPNFNKMTKNELEAYGRTVGIELDKRKKKATLIIELTEHIDNNK